MAETARCKNCEASVRADAPFGHCAKCLLELGFGPLPAEATSPTSAHGDNAKSFGDYRILELIGRGGMGVVYKARHIRLNRLVALKTILAGELASPALVERFRIETEAAASLDHPNIVPIYEVGERDQHHFFSMKLIEGTSLDQLISKFGFQDGNDLSPGPPSKQVQTSIAQLMAKVARAVHYAHQRGILHRDLKPSNILVDTQGEPHLTDFGVARIVQQSSGPTLTGAVIGTPSYMAPEQASGGTKHLTTAADVYSLGAILYELLTGRPPFQAETCLELLRRAAECEPTRPSSVNRRVERDLEIIALKCLEKDPHRRYRTALELAEELGRFLSGEPIEARPVSRAEKLWRLCCRNPSVAGLSTALVVVILSGALIGLSQGPRSPHADSAAVNPWQARNVILDGTAATNGLTYHVRLPQAYDAKRGLPAIVLLHGANMNSKSYLETIVAEWPKLAQDFILIGINGEQRVKDSPTNNPAYYYTYVDFAGRSKYKGFPGTHRQSPALIAEATVELKRQLKITKLFIGGHSQGGFCAYSTFMNYPEFFAGAFPISAGVIIQAEPAAYTNTTLRAQQRGLAIAIVHGETDPLIPLSQAKATHESFIQEGFPSLHFFTHANAGHRFSLLPIEDAIRWLEAITSDNPAQLLDFAQARLTAGEFRDASAALQRWRQADAANRFSMKAEDIARGIEKEASVFTNALVAALLEAKDDSWVDGFQRFRAQFEFTDSARDVMDLYGKLRAKHEKPAEDLWWGARSDFQNRQRDAGYAKCEELVKQYFASTFYRYAKQALRERK